MLYIFYIYKSHISISRLVDGFWIFILIQQELEGYLIINNIINLILVWQKQTASMHGNRRALYLVAKQSGNLIHSLSSTCKITSYDWTKIEYLLYFWLFVCNENIDTYCTFIEKCEILF